MRGVRDEHERDSNTLGPNQPRSIRAKRCVDTRQRREIGHGGERGAAAKTRDDVNVDDARDDDDDDDAIVTKEIHLPRPTLETTASEDGPREARGAASRFGLGAPRRCRLDRDDSSSADVPSRRPSRPLRASRATAL